jgi:hypothetical protein
VIEYYPADHGPNALLGIACGEAVQTVLPPLADAICKNIRNTKDARNRTLFDKYLNDASIADLIIKNVTQNLQERVAASVKLFRNTDSYSGDPLCDQACLHILHADWIGEICLYLKNKKWNPVLGVSNSFSESEEQLVAEKVEEYILNRFYSYLMQSLIKYRKSFLRRHLLSQMDSLLTSTDRVLALIDGSGGV